ncbi:hypothetical protein AERO8C_70590 [Aeromonas veronii]|uniref:Uncharacterized protein n=1 Tax=Aeromonas veronii TaxID=654 RepID=A0A653LC80_AERVE|nr:hypothetical protein AERO8C_70590 [Aeromonas veronii]
MRLPSQKTNLKTNPLISVSYLVSRESSIILAWLRVRLKAPASYSRYGRSLTRVSPPKTGQENGSILTLRLKN